MDCSGKGRHKVCSKAISLLWSGHEAKVETVGSNQVLFLNFPSLEPHCNLTATSLQRAFQATVYFDQLAETQLPVSKHGISIHLQTAHQYVIQLEQLHVKVMDLRRRPISVC